MYLQCEPDEEPWDDDAIWDELDRRFGMAVNRGPIFEKGVTPMRSFVVEPMQHERLYPGRRRRAHRPADRRQGPEHGDGRRLPARARDRRRRGAGGATRERALERVWRVQHFSWWMTSMLHRFAGDDDFQLRLQLSQLRFTASSAAQATALAENYVGMPFARVGSPRCQSPDRLRRRPPRPRAAA